jgi:outer membrane protein assembly factor BamB
MHRPQLSISKIKSQEPVQKLKGLIGIHRGKEPKIRCLSVRSTPKHRIFGLFTANPTEPLKGQEPPISAIGPRVLDRSFSHRLRSFTWRVIICSMLSGCQYFPLNGIGPGSLPPDPTPNQKVPVTGLGGGKMIYLPLVQVGSATTPIPTPTPMIVSTGDWAQLSGNPQRTGYTPANIPTPWHVKWIWNGPAGGGDSGPAPDHLALPQDVQPITGNGRLYIGHSDGVVRAISETTGHLVWSSQNLGAPILNTGAFDPDSNSVYFGAKNGKFYQLDAATGAQKRVTDLRGDITMAPLLAGDTVYVGSSVPAASGVQPIYSGGTLYALNKADLVQRWSYDAGAGLVATPSYSANHGGLIILLAEDKSVHALQAGSGTRLWRAVVNADIDPKRGTVFADTYPVISDANDIVVVRSYLNWSKMWLPSTGAPAAIADIRAFLAQNPTLQSFFVLGLGDGSSKYVAPVMLGSIGNGGDFMNPPPQVTLRTLPDNSQVAYLLWRNQQACINPTCDGREDTTVGEMDLTTGNIRFVQDYKNQGDMRLPTDEQSPLSIAGDTLFYAHWMLLGGLQITDRSGSLGGTYKTPIKTHEIAPVVNTLSAGACPGRSNHACPTSGMSLPCDSFLVNPGFYIYASNTCAYSQFWSNPVRNAVIHNRTIFYKSMDGAIIAVGS